MFTQITISAIEMEEPHDDPVEKAVNDSHDNDVSNDTPLLQAAGDIAGLEALFSRGVNINGSDHKDSPLLVSAAQGHVDVVRRLVEHGADVNIKTTSGESFVTVLLGTSCFSEDFIAEIISKCDSSTLTPISRKRLGSTPIIAAAKFGRNVCLKILISKSLNTSIDPNDLLTEALLTAAENGQSSCMETLISAGADVNGSDPFHRPLFVSVSKGQTECARCLLELGADVNMKGGLGDSLLHDLLRKTGFSEDFIVQVVDRFHEDILITKDTNCQKTPIMIASMKGKALCLRALLDKLGGTEFLNATDALNKTALMLASEYGTLSCINILIARGADINLKSFQGKTSLMYASEYGHLECVKELYYAGVPIDHTGDDKLSAIFLAAKNGHLDCVKFLAETEASLEGPYNSTLLHFVLRWDADSQLIDQLLGKGLDVNAKNADGITPLIMSIKYRRLNHVRQLVDNGAMINVNGACTLHSNPLILSIDSHQTDIARYLLNTDAEINVSDESGDTPLHHLIRKYNTNLAEKLIQMGADLVKKNNKGKSALSLAIDINKISFIKLIGNHFKTQVIESNETNFNAIRSHICLDVRLESRSPSMLLTLAEFGFIPYLSLNQYMQFSVLIYSRYTVTADIQIKIENEILTPLQAAFMREDVGAVLYLLVNGFITDQDVGTLFCKTKFYQRIYRQLRSVKLKNFLTEMTKNLLPLEYLCLVQISSCMNHFLPGERRNEAVDSLSIPRKLKSIFKISGRLARLCPDEWNKIESEIINSKMEFNFSSPMDPCDALGDRLLQKVVRIHDTTLCYYCNGQGSAFRPKISKRYSTK